MNKLRIRPVSLHCSDVTSRKMRHQTLPPPTNHQEFDDDVNIKLLSIAWSAVVPDDLVPLRDHRDRFVCWHAQCIGYMTRVGVEGHCVSTRRDVRSFVVGRGGGSIRRDLKRSIESRAEWVTGLEGVVWRFTCKFMSDNQTWWKSNNFERAWQVECPTSCEL